MIELAKKVIDLTGSDSKIVYKPLPLDDPTQRKPVIDLAKKELDWIPQINRSRKTVSLIIIGSIMLILRLSGYLIHMVQT